MFSRIMRKLGLSKRKVNTIKNNLEKWSEWNWSRKGEEWSNTSEWKDSLVKHVLRPNIPTGSCVLEIGPGAGRWTEYLVERSTRLIIVDLTPKCIEICKERFKDFKNIEYFVNDGKNLDFISDDSIDGIWSWDVFVHIQSEDVKEYVQQFARIIRPGGRGVIHHCKDGISDLGWRSDMTAEKMRTYCKEYGLEVLKQFEAWDNDCVQIWPNLPVGKGPDVVSVFCKPTK